MRPMGNGRRGTPARPAHWALVHDSRKAHSYAVTDEISGAWGGRDWETASAVCPGHSLLAARARRNPPCSRCVTSALSVEPP